MYGRGREWLKFCGYYAWFSSAHNLLFIHLILTGGLNIWPGTGKKLTGLYFWIVQCFCPPRLHAGQTKKYGYIVCKVHSCYSYLFSGTDKTWAVQVLEIYSLCCESSVCQAGTIYWYIHFTSLCLTPGSRLFFPVYSYSGFARKTCVTCKTLRNYASCCMYVISSTHQMTNNCC